MNGTFISDMIILPFLYLSARRIKAVVKHCKYNPKERTEKPENLKTSR
jgi:hypothetical protein